MTDWARGYPIGDLYPPAWHPFQSPAHLRASCALSGAAWLVGSRTPLCIADVGCGTGYTASVLAAGNPSATVVGLDYNPAEIAEARDLAAAAGLSNATFLEVDLAELDAATLAALPEFDLITVHGVWSWVADPVRDGILRLIASRLKTGGVVLLSYNALPGAAGALGLAGLVRKALDTGGGRAGLGAARALVKRLVAAEAVHLPRSTWRNMLTGDLQAAQDEYLLHEFSTAHWRPSFFADVAASMATARCTFVGSATLDENIPGFTLSPAQREIFDEAPDIASRQMILDLCAPRAFRRDIYVRGLRPVACDAAIDDLWLASSSCRAGEIVLTTQAGEARMPRELVDAARAALAEGPLQIARLRTLPGCDQASPAELLVMLVGSGCARPLWRHPGDGDDWSLARGPAQRLNGVAAQRFAPHGIGRGQMALATPALGGGLPVSALELAVAQICAQAIRADAGAAPDARMVIDRLVPPEPQPEVAVRDELDRVISALLVDKLPVWKQLGVT